MTRGSAESDQGQPEVGRGIGESDQGQPETAGGSREMVPARGGEVWPAGQRELNRGHIGGEA